MEELQRLGVRERVTLTGLVPPSEIPRLLSASDIVAHTSQWEGLPRAVVQGLLLEKPVAAFAIDGTPEVVHDGETGRLLPLNDEVGFADALCTLAGDAALRARLGKAGRALCVERFSAEKMVADLSALYRSSPR